MSELKNKLSANAKHFRYLSRAETFHRNRKGVEELDYLKYYNPQQKEAILASLHEPIPSPLPPPSPQTISFYRRSSQPIYRTKSPDSLQIHGHMLYESLWILASVQDKSFQNYQAIVKEFQADLPTYLLVNSSDIREMAVIAAGNKIIGREADIVQIVEADPKQLWVLVNHILDKKIPFKTLMPYINTPYQIVFKTLYELTIGKEDEAVLAIVEDESAADTIINALRSPNQEIVKYAIRIIGNIVAEGGEHAEVFYRKNLTDHLVYLLSRGEQVRRDACWLASNICCDRHSATRLIRHQQVMARFVQLFSSQRSLQIQRELTYVFAYLAHFAERSQAFSLLAHQNVLQLCYTHLCREDNQMSSVTLFLLSQLLQLGESCKDQQDTNVFCAMISRMGDLRSQISKKSYSEHNEISSLSIDIMAFIEDNEE